MSKRKVAMMAASLSVLVTAGCMNAGGSTAPGPKEPSAAEAKKDPFTLTIYTQGVSLEELASARA